MKVLFDTCAFSVNLSLNSSKKLNSSTLGKSPMKNGKTKKTPSKVMRKSPSKMSSIYIVCSFAIYLYELDNTHVLFIVYISNWQLLSG